MKFLNLISHFLKRLIMKLVKKYYFLLIALFSFSIFASEERYANAPPPATNPQNPQSQMNNQNPNSVNQQMLREQNMRTLRNQQDRKDGFPVSPKTKPESNSDYLTPSEQKQK